MNSDTVMDYIKFINEHDISKIMELISDDHTFTDANNNTVQGRENMKNGWLEYFSMFPNYKIEADEMYEAGSIFIILGFASGTLKGGNPEKNHWKLPAAWKAVVEKGKIKCWQIYCDTKIPVSIIEKNT